MYSLYKELLPTSSVSFALSGKFTYLTNRAELVIIKTSWLQLYEIKDINDEPTLNLLYQHKLNGIVTSIDKIKPRNLPHNIDYLVLSFKDAKMSVLEFNAQLYKFITVSMHYYEKEELKQTFLNHPFQPKIQVDPDNRCVGMLFYHIHLAILPFKYKDLEIEDNSNQPFEDSFLIDISTVLDKLISIVDLVFLEAYSTPTLAVLYSYNLVSQGDPYKDASMGMVVLTLDTTTRNFHVIDRNLNLPSDCQRLARLPKGIGGVLVVASTSILHLNQGTSYALALNNFASRISKYNFNTTLDLNLTLDLSSNLKLDDGELLFALKNGDLYRLTMQLETKRINKMNFERSGASVISSSLCRVDEELFFLASEVGDSLLIKYKKNVLFKSDDEAGDQPILADLDGLYNDFNFDYGQDQNDQLKVQSKEYSYQVVDSLLNLGPFSSAALGFSEYLWEHVGGRLPKVHTDHNDLVACSGYGKNGSLSVIHFFLRPKVISEFKMDGTSLFTLSKRVHPNYHSEGNEHSIKGYHDFMLISNNHKTLVLATGEELKEVPSTQFYTAGPTIACQLLKDSRVIIQVYRTGFRLINEHGKQVLNITVATNRSRDQMLTWAQLSDPYLQILNAADKLTVYKITNKNSIDAKPILVLEDASVKACVSYLYKDTVGLFNYYSEVEQLPANSEYYHSTNANPQPTKSTPRHFLVVLKQTGDLEMYRFPDMKLCFSIDRFDDFCNMFKDTSQENLNLRFRPSTYRISINDIAIYTLGHKVPKTYMFVSTYDQSLVVYQIIPDCIDAGPAHRLAIKLIKLDINLGVAPNLDLKRSADNSNNEHDDKDEDVFDALAMGGPETKFTRFQPFEQLSKFQGVFITGKLPALAIVTSKSELKLYRLGLEPEVIAFNPFHNPNCPFGFAYMTKSGYLKLAQIPNFYKLEVDLPCRKVNLGRTPHFVTYHYESRTYVLVTSTEVKYQRSEDYATFTAPLDPLQLNNPNASTNVDSTAANEEIVTEVGLPPELYYPDRPHYKLELVSPITYEVVDTYEFGDNEVVTNCQSMGLDTKYVARKNFVVVSTTTTQGEEMPLKARLYLFEVIDVVPLPDNPRTDHKLKKILVEDIKNPVTALASTNGYLVSSVGSKVIVRSFKEGTNLEGVAFIDVQIYVTSLSCIKQFILVGDAYKSVWFLGFQEEPYKLLLLGKDFTTTRNVIATQLIHLESKLNFLVSDIDGNLVTLDYRPKDVRALSGQRLIHNGDFYLGVSVNKWLRSTHSNTKSATDRSLALGISSQGSVVAILPIHESKYRRLHLLLNHLTSYLQHLAGLNPKAYRLIKTNTHLPPNKNVLDCDLLVKYLNMPFNHQVFLAQSIGSNRNGLLTDLLEVVKDCRF